MEFVAFFDFWLQLVYVSLISDEDLFHTCNIALIELLEYVLVTKLDQWINGLGKFFHVLMFMTFKDMIEFIDRKFCHDFEVTSLAACQKQFS